MKDRAAKQIRELNKRYWKDLSSILREHGLAMEDIYDFAELLPPFYPTFACLMEIERLSNNIRRFDGEFQKRSDEVIINMLNLTETVRATGDKLFRVPLVGKLDLKKFAKASTRKLLEMKAIWVTFVFTFLSLALFFPTNSTNGSFISRYFDNLYTILMAFTTVGFGDIHPVTLFSRFVSAFLGIIGAATVGLSVTVFWSAAVEASKK